MSELAERAEKLWLAVRDISDYGGTLAGIEQALLAERRLAMEEMRLLLCPLCRRNEEFDGQFHRVKDAMTARDVPYRKVQCSALKVRAAAEKEVGK